MPIAMLVLGAVLGAAIAWLLARRAVQAAQAREAAATAAISKLAHDVRGAMSPALLMAEHLESNSDPAVKRAATTIAQAMERAAEMARTASARAKSGELAKPS
jgi:hypothetical protein